MADANSPRGDRRLAVGLKRSAPAGYVPTDAATGTEQGSDASMMTGIASRKTMPSRENGKAA
jgi:hypothetical protein